MEECIICFDETTQFIFLPCAHKICIHCKGRLEHKICPICNTRFEPEHRIQIQEPVQQVQPVTMTKACSRCGSFSLIFFVAYVVYRTLDSEL